MSSLVRITERVAAPFAGAKVDREAGVIHGASICGFESANGNDYSRESFGDGKQYEGRHVYLNHGRERRAEDKIGWFENVRFRDNGTPEGEFHVLKSHPVADRILEAAERNPSLFGFSHTALCRTSRGAKGRQKVEAVEKVDSIDLVAEPATTRSLFEGTGMTTTLRKLLEGCEAKLDGDRRKRLRKLLVEADDGLMGDVMDSAVDAPADDLSGDEAIDGSIRSLAMAILDDDSLATDEKLKKLRLVLQTKDKLNGTATEKKSEPADDKPAEESRQLQAQNDQLIRENAVLKLTAGHKLTEAQHKALVRCDDDAERKVLLESWQPRPGEKPTAAGRMSAAELLGKSSGKMVEEGKTTDAKTFAASIRN